ncbi:MULTISPECIES: carbohydrate ABC transporter permease [unclassified Microbacterium]|uniref:carbohydrate ABC transporter permease n=1 Tax=unclassified Microbacterium TaxID=2609290 RepID=UPI00214B5D73|nr:MULTISPECIES: carbohydrate ABC transporter permease [unclassified Microbacterium]MCR2801291.1 carbohydrate ABC transporter permease [Microbacterium sp. zg.Y818]MCR2824442.1 carbohydrate ABC transporter permease [Microbacterium sp. zg.Y909]WIM21123.1 carbohydrate ABC transporter permease [Microbacterium sp. zg-Y818]
MSTALIENISGPGAKKYAERRAAKGKPVNLSRPSDDSGGRRPGWVTYGLLSVVVVASIFPLYYAAILGSSTRLEIAQSALPRLVPGPNLLANIGAIISNHQIDFWTSFANSLIVAVLVSAATVFFSTLAGFAFAKLGFRARNALYVFVIATLAIPMQLGTVPMFIMMNEFGWIDSLTALIVPSLVTAFGVFWMTQYLKEALPYELIEAARVDGATVFRTFWSIALPAARPAAATLALFTFVGSWNDFFWPSVVLRSQKTLPLVIPQLSGAFTADHALIMSGVFLIALPLLVAFVFLGRQLVAGVMAGAVKG